MSIIHSAKSQTDVTYAIDTSTITRLIAHDLGIPAKQLTVEYIIGDLGPSDPMDRFDPPRGVVGIKVTHKTEHDHAGR